MNLKKFKGIEIVFLIVLIIFDQLTKNFATNIFKNYGIFSGSLSHTPQLFRVVFLSTLAIYLFAIYLWLLFFLSRLKNTTLSLALSGYMAGILGNVIDRLNHGYVTDFIHVNLPYMGLYIFNIADIYQVVFLLILLTTIYQNYDLIWHPNRKRSNFFVNKKFQILSIVIFNTVLLVFFLSLLAFSYSYLQSYLQYEHFMTVKNTFLIGFISVWFSFSIGFSFFVLFYTQKISGPLVAFKNFLQRMDENSSPLKLRGADFHKEEIEELSKIVLKKFDK